MGVALVELKVRREDIGALHQFLKDNQHPGKLLSCIVEFLFTECLCVSFANLPLTTVIHKA